MEETINAWITRNRDDVEKIGMKVIGISNEYAKLEIGGYTIDVIIPSTFHHSLSACSDSLNSDSVFTAITSEEQVDGRLSETLLALTEKLERVRIGPDCLNRVFDTILQVFEYYKCRKPENQRNRAEQAEHLKLVSYLRKLAEVARLQCKEQPSTVDSILPWCSVSLNPCLASVQLEMELKKIMGSDKATRALGFCLDGPMIIDMSFGHLAGKEVSVNSFRSVEVSVKQSLNQIQQAEASKQKVMDGLEDERLRNAIGKCCPSRVYQYGPQVLVPELVKEFFYECSTSENRADHTGQVAESNNILVGLLTFLGTRLKNLSKWCVICRKDLPPSSRLWYCDAELCLYRFEEVGIGVSVLQELQNSELIEFELSLAADATTSHRDVFEPYPAFLLKTREIRKRSGFFSNYTSSGSIGCLESIESTISSVISNAGKEYVDNKDLHLLHSLINSFPSVAEMQECTGEIELMLKLGASWLTHLSNSGNFKRNNFSDAENVWLPYNVLRYVLFTNRLSMHILQENIRLNVPTSLYQFAVFYNYEREQYFNHRRMTEGSLFAFHGSHACNWYSIIRNGLRCLSTTNYMSSGKAYGEGIYFSTKMDDSCFYSSPLSGWQNGNLKEYGVVAICEILSGKSHFVNQSYLVIPPKNENDVAIRYLILWNNKYNKARSITITGNHMLSGQADLLDLLEHYKLLRNRYFEDKVNVGLIRRNQHLD